tara:strand:+ start:2989 stop:4743 length:1755 start_codon:yes stop_codon:yes gene_type:complete
MKIKKELFQLFILFLFEELKIIKIKIQYVITLFKEINILKYFLSKINNENIIDIFLNKDQNKFISITKKLSSKKYFKINSKKKIFVESFINHPIYTISNCYISKIISNTLGRESLGILRSGDIKGTKIMNSFGINKIIYVHEGNFFSRFYYLFVAYNYLIGIKNIESLIKFKINKIEFGSAIYEQYIRFKKEPNLYKINLDLYYLLSRALNYNSQFQKIFKNERNAFLIQSETQYFPFRICLQNSLKYKNKIISKRGISSVGVRTYEKFEERNENRNKIPKKLFNFMYKNLNKKNHYKIKKFFKEYHSEKFGRDAYQLIDNNRKYFNKFRTKKELCNYFNWEVKKPIVLILAHQLTDGNLNNKWNLFQNDMIWMVETIKKIVSIKDVNWLIKPHPSEEIYNTKITTKTIFNDLCNNNYNIKLFPDNLDTKNLNTFIKAAISSHGTAGCEFPGFGVPTIICGDTRYSGLGFNIEPRTKSQYFKILEKIGFLKKIDNKIIKKSQFFIYLYYYLAEAKIPIIYESSIRMNYNQNKFWKSSLKLINKHELRENIFSKSLKFQIKNKKPLFLNLEKIKNFKNKYLLFKF